MGAELVVAAPKQVGYVVPDIAAMVEQAKAVLETVKDFTIDSTAMYEIAGEELVGISALAKKLEDERVATKKPFWDEGKAIDAMYKQPLDILATAASTLNTTITTWRKEQKRLADLEQARLDKIAADQRAKAKEEADALVAAGRVEEAQAVAEAAAVISAPTVVSTVPKVSGIVPRKTWKATKIDLLEVVKAIAADPEKLGLHIAGLAAIQSYWDGLARQYKGGVQVPGVTMEEVESTTARS